MPSTLDYNILEERIWDLYCIVVVLHVAPNEHWMKALKNNNRYETLAQSASFCDSVTMNCAQPIICYLDLGIFLSVKWV